jgi:hypothetical protein
MNKEKNVFSTTTFRTADFLRVPVSLKLGKPSDLKRAGSSFFASR